MSALEEKPALKPLPPHATLGGDDLKPLRCFLAVAEELNFTRAARRMGLSQPQLSRAVARLEGELGVELLRRTSREVALTEAGHSLRLTGAETLLALERAYAQAQHRAGESNGHVRIGWASGAAGIRSSDVFRTFTKQHPDITIELCHMPWSDQIAAVTEGRVDLQFLRSPAIPTGLRVEPLFYEDRVVAMANNHPLARRKSLKLADIRLEPLITAAVPKSWADWWNVSPRPDGGAPRYMAAVATAEEMFEHVAAGRGIAITGGAAMFFFARADVAYVPITDIDPILISLAWRSDQETAAMRAFIAVTRSVLLDRSVNPAPQAA
ncbi:MAG TPA: LysR family transcriptional regulator [Solirubrobacteraceae bacterium]|nr:LysR family transcriptional regulator [Solirubrobacteraceae bacterium]